MFTSNRLTNSKFKAIAKFTMWVFVFGMMAQPLMVSAATADVYNIAAPNAAGVSVNSVQQVVVGSNGLIYNNSATAVQTQLNGLISGNSNLAASGSASTILVQATGSVASQINGVIEVGGQRADLVIASPSGISVGSGAGFINTGRATLTTGTPVFGGSGSLASFRVTGGQITVDGSLDATGIDRVDLISRAVAVNGAVNANELNVVAGGNTVDYATLSAQRIRGLSPLSQAAIDVAALGGMYAGKIKLVSTERGVGVNSLGTISALNGNVTLDSRGNVKLAGTTTASGAITASGAALDLSGGNMTAGAAISLTATNGNINNSGGSITTNDALRVTTPGAFINTQYGSIVAVGNGDITAGSVQNSQGFITVGGDMTVTLSGTGSYASAGSSSSSGFSPMCSGGGSSNPPSQTGTNQYVFDNSNGSISAGGNLTIQAGTSSSSNSYQSYGYTGYCSGSKGYSNSGNSNIQYFINNSGGYIAAGNDLTMKVQLTGSKTGNSEWDRCASQAASTGSSQYIIDNSNYGFISAGNNLTVTILGTGSSNGSYGSYGSYGQCGSSSSQTQSGSVNTIYALNNNSGMISAGNNLVITAQDASASQSTGSSSGISANCTSQNSSQTSNSSNNQYFIDNTNGWISAGNDASLTVQGVVSTTTVVTYVKSQPTKCGSSKTTKVTTTTTSSDTTIDNTNGSISAGNNLTIKTQGIVDNTGGELTSDNATKITAYTVQDQQGTISGDTSVQIITQKPVTY